MRRRWMIPPVMVVVLLASALPASAGDRISFRGELTDLSAMDDPFDGARAAAVARVGNGHTIVRLKVKHIDRDYAGSTFGAHVHVGDCVENNGAAAGPHYNAGGDVSPETEVWLDFTVRRSGSARAKATVPFEIPAGGASSIVIHENPTAPDGAAGARLACLPLEF